MSINITTGSDKQNAWANQIAGAWLASIDREIESIDRRISEGDALLAPYKTLLTTGREKFVSAASAWAARDVIDRKANDYGRAMIDQARKAFDQQKATA